MPPAANSNLSKRERESLAQNGLDPTIAGQVRAALLAVRPNERSELALDGRSETDMRAYVLWAARSLGHALVWLPPRPGFVRFTVAPRHATPPKPPARSPKVARLTQPGPVIRPVPRHLKPALQLSSSSVAARPVTIEPFDLTRPANLDAWIRRISGRWPNALFRLELSPRRGVSLRPKKLRQKITKAAQRCGLQAEWESQESMQFRLTSKPRPREAPPTPSRQPISAAPLWNYLPLARTRSASRQPPSAAGSALLPSSKPVTSRAVAKRRVVPPAPMPISTVLAPRKLTPGAGLVCGCLAPLAADEAVRFVCECVAQALIGPNSPVDRLLGCLNGWELSRDGRRTTFFPPSDLDNDARGRVLDRLAFDVGALLSAYGMSAGSSPKPEWAIAAEPDAGSRPAPRVPLERLLEPAWAVQVGSRRYASALAPLDDLHAELVLARSPGKPTRARWRAELGFPATWTPLQVAIWHEQTACLGPAAAGGLLSILEFLRRMSPELSDDLRQRVDAWQSAVSARAQMPPSEYGEPEWLELVREAAADAARRPGLVAFMTDHIGAVYAYDGIGPGQTFVRYASLRSGGLNALAAARRLGSLALAAYVWPQGDERYVTLHEWLQGAVQPVVGQGVLARLTTLAQKWEMGLRTRTARGARGPRVFVMVEQLHLRRAGLDAVAILKSTGVEHTVRLQLVEPPGLSVFDLRPADAIRRVLAPEANAKPLPLVLDCFLLALLYDMCVANVPLIPITNAGGLRLERALGGDPTAHRPADIAQPAYLPDRDRVLPRHIIGDSHASPAMHDVTWFVRRLPPGRETSDDARDHARQYGVELKPGETFVLPHVRGLGHQYFYLGDRELRSTHALGEFERAFLAKMDGE